MERRNSSLEAGLRKAPIYAVGQSVWVYIAFATIHQRTEKDTDDRVLKAKLSLNWTGPYTILAWP